MECTVVSFLPLAVENESKPGLYPGNFSIPASDAENPQVIHVANSAHYVYLDHERGSYKATAPADEVAASIVNDYCSSTLGYVGGEASPGLFWVEGKIAAKDVLRRYPDECLEALRRQKNWFITLVKIADDDYNRTRQLRSISDLQRFAAKFLNLDREWNVEANVEKMQRCPACSEVINASVVVCPKCTAILDPQKYEQFQFAGRK